MTQFQHTLKQLLSGEKYETSRLVKPGDYNWMCGEMPAPWTERGTVMQYSAVHFASHTARFVRDREYTIQPGRAQKSVGKYVIESIWRQDVRTLLLGQVDAEGFRADWLGFWRVWCTMYDREGLKFFTDRFNRPLTAPLVKKYLELRPNELYTAWRMRIRVLWDTVDWEAPAVAALQIENRIEVSISSADRS